MTQKKAKYPPYQKLQTEITFSKHAIERAKIRNIEIKKIPYLFQKAKRICLSNDKSRRLMYLYQLDNIEYIAIEYGLNKLHVITLYPKD